MRASTLCADNLILFELSNAPKFLQGGRYQCFGVIRCRLQADATVKLLAQIHPASLVFVDGTKTLGYYDGVHDLCSSCHRYRKRIEFFVRHLTESITISVQSATRPKRKIGAFPQTVQWFVDQQGLEAVFGTAYHRDMQHCFCKLCSNGAPSNQGYSKRRLDSNREQFLTYKKPCLSKKGGTQPDSHEGRQS